VRTSVWVTAASTTILALALTACGGPSATVSPAASASAAASANTTPTPEPTAHPSIAPLTSIDGITVDGEFGKAPAISFTAPFAIDATKSKVLKAGTGPVVAETNYVDVNYQGVNAYTGKTFDSSFTRGQSAQFPLSGVVAGFKTGLVGKHVGDRVLVVMPGKDGYDGSGGSGDGSILIGDSLVFVVDILDIDYAKPYGTPVAPKAGLPTVAVDANGVPSVTINSATAAPTATVIEPLIAGSGTRKVAATDSIAVHYRMYSWKTGKLLTDSFADPDSGNLSDALPCWKEGLVNQPLGSRIMLVCPPVSGFPSGNPTPAVEAGDTVVFVVDLMFAQPNQ